MAGSSPAMTDGARGHAFISEANAFSGSAKSSTEPWSLRRQFGLS